MGTKRIITYNIVLCQVTDKFLMLFLCFNSYHPKSAAMSSEGFHYKRGAAQLFSQPTHTINPSKFSDEEVIFFPHPTPNKYSL